MIDDLDPTWISEIRKEFTVFYKILDRLTEDRGWTEHLPDIDSWTFFKKNWKATVNWTSMTIKFKKVH
jgi:hypothetical protein